MKKTLLVGLTLLIPVGVAAAMWAGAERLEDRIGSASARPLPDQLGCEGPGLVNQKLQVCEFASPSSEAGTSVYLVGDSHAAHFTKGLLEAATEAGQSLSVFTASGCSLLDGVYSSLSDEDFDECAAWQNKALERLDTSEPGIVIVAAADVYWLDGRQMVSDDGSRARSAEEKLTLYEEGLKRALDRVALAGHSLVLVHTVPTWTGDFDWRLESCTLADTLAGCNQEMPLSSALAQSAGAREVLERQGDASGARVVDFSDTVCPDGLCQTYQNGDWVYRDFSHITNNFSATLAPKWEQVLEEAVAGR